jgi:hypothetical protein
MAVTRVTMTHPSVADPAQVTLEAFELVWQPKGWVLVDLEADSYTPSSMIWIGAWDALEVYAAGDVVSFDGDGYVAKRTNQDVEPPTDSSKWDLVTTGTGTVPTTPDATTILKGKVQLAGDLAGIASWPTVPGLALKIPLTEKGAAGGVASLDADGKVPVAQVPATALGDTFTAASEAEMLALAATHGDLAIRTDFDPDQFFMLVSDSPATLADWRQISLPGSVMSVDGQVGAVDLSDVYASAGDLTTRFPAWDETPSDGQAFFSALRRYVAPGIEDQDDLEILSTFGPLTGSAKWRGGVETGSKVYGIPYDSPRVLKIDPATERVKTFGAVGTGLGKWAGGALAANVRIYCAPYNAESVLVITPSTDTTYELGSTTGGVGSARWRGIVAAPNGKLYCIPAGARSVLVITPTSTSGGVTIPDSVSEITGLPAGADKWHGGVLVGNLIYCIPHNASTVLVIDTTTDTVSTFGALASTATKWDGGALAANGNIYCIPSTATQVLKINPTARMALLVGTAQAATVGKWAGAVLANGRIYGIPLGVTDLLKIDPTTDTVTTIAAGGSGWSGGAFVGGGSVWGVPHNATTVLKIDPATDIPSTVSALSAATKHSGGVLAGNGKIYCTPRSATSVLVIDTATGGIEQIGTVAGGAQWYGAVLAGNGKIYGMPHSATAVLKIDPDTDTLSQFGSVPLGGAVSARWIGGQLAPNGKIYGTPYNGTEILKIDPDTDTVSSFGSVSVDTGKWYSSRLASNGKIYCIPFQAQTILVIDPATDTTYEITPPGLDLSDISKWSGGALGPNGCIYGVPYNSSSVLKIDPATDTVTRFGVVSGNVGGTRWRGAALAPDGLIYCAPLSGETILVIDPSDDTVFEFGYAEVVGPNDVPHGPDKWFGAVLAPDGYIYGIPYTQTQVLRLRAPGRPVPADLRLSRHTNRF